MKAVRAWARWGAAGVALLVLAGCEDLAGLGNGGIGGVALLQAGSTVASADAGGSASGSIGLPAGGRRDLEVVIRDRSGAEVGLGLGQTLRVSVTNTVLATWESAGPTSGTLRGRASGVTSLEVQVLEGGLSTYVAVFPLVVS